MLFQLDNNSFKKLDTRYQPSALHEVFADDPQLPEPSDLPASPLFIPPLIEPTADEHGVKSYKVTAHTSKHYFDPDRASDTLAYNDQSILGPTIKLHQGDQVAAETVNDLKDVTTFHWHGLLVEDDADGGCHMPVKPGTSAPIHFDVINEAATLWYHPHPLHQTARQVYEGLAGMMIIEDENSERLKENLPHTYGVDDIPLITQDRFLVDGYRVDYDASYGQDGTAGDTLIVNGTVNPTLDVEQRFLRLRIVNGSNVSNFKYRLANGVKMYQIATDGGFLNYPVEVTDFILSASERAEVLIDLNQIEEDQVELLINDVAALTIRIKDRQLNAQFDPNMSLRTDMLKIYRPEDLKDVPTKLMALSGTDNRVAINGVKFDILRVDETAKQNEWMVWEVVNVKDEMEVLAHPYHVHGTQFRILDRNGKLPPRNELGWKDTVIVNPGETVHLLLKFPKVGMFMYHCHILEHEDHGMMGHIQISESGTEKLAYGSHSAHLKGAYTSLQSNEAAGHAQNK